VLETIHLQYMTRTHGNGITSTAPMKNTTERQVKSQIPKSIESGATPAEFIGRPPDCASVGADAARESKPGISPAFCQPAIPSVQISISGVTIPRATKSRNWASG
jgi:hypothetical protein